MIYVILGMHKSGTTLIAESLMKSGINMGFDLNPEESDYLSEKCESRLLRDINKYLLKSHNKGSDTISRLPLLQEEELKRVESMIQTFIEKQKKYADWGMKDPRLVLTFDMWKKYLDQYKLIVVFREPEDVVMHYLKVYSPIRQLLFFPYLIYRALKVWRIYNEQILKISAESTVDTIFINYNKFMKSEVELEKLSDFVGIDLKDCRSTRFKRPMKKLDNFLRHYLNIVSFKEKKLMYKMVSIC